MFMLLILKMLRLSDIPVRNDQVNHNLCFFSFYNLSKRSTIQSVRIHRKTYRLS